MSTKKAYFLCCVLLLLIELSLFLVGGFGAKREVIQTGERSFTLIVSTFFLSVFVLPTLIVFSIVCGGLGCIQNWIALPEILKRIFAYFFASGIVLNGIAAFIRGRIAGDDYHHVLERARWTAFWGTIFLIVPLLFHFYGFGRHALLKRFENRLRQPLEFAGGKTMRAAKMYVLGGLLLILWSLLRTFWLGWPWEEERVVGMSKAFAGLVTWPLGAALGAAALFLSVLQPLIVFHERIKAAGAVVYFGGTSLFLGSLYSDLLREHAFDEPFSKAAGAGLALLVVAVLLNLAGLLRGHEKFSGEASIFNR